MDKDTADALTAFAREVAQLLVESLNLENRPEDLDPEQALFGEGLGWTPATSAAMPSTFLLR